MKKKIYALLLTLAIGTTANAQFNYDLSTHQETYQELSGGTSVNGTNKWDDNDYKIPIGFNFMLGGQVLTHISTDGSFFATDTSGIVSGFLVTDIDIHDRGNAGGSTSESPITYQVTGTSPNRIFKFQVTNAGMYDEYDIYFTNTDSLSYQVWLYEADNSFEVHYGPSQITYPADYHYFSGYPLVGFMKNISSTTGNLDKFYFLAGNANAPVIDSTSNILFISGGLNSYPSNGTVYRFKPYPVGLKGIEKGNTQVSLLANTGTNNIVLSNNSNSVTTYNVINMNGAQIGLKGQLSKGNNSIDISSLASGMYLLQVQNDNGLNTFRISKF